MLPLGTLRAVSGSVMRDSKVRDVLIGLVFTCKPCSLECAPGFEVALCTSVRGFTAGSVWTSACVGGWTLQALMQCLKDRCKLQELGLGAKTKAMLVQRTEHGPCNGVGLHVEDLFGRRFCSPSVEFGTFGRPILPPGGRSGANWHQRVPKEEAWRSTSRSRRLLAEK